MSRLDDFQGLPEEYVSYLERQLISLRQTYAHLCSECHTRIARPHIATDPPARLPTQKLEFVHCEPQLGQNFNAIRPKPDSSRWKGDAVALIGETPQAEDWENMLKRNGVYDIMCDGQAIAHLWSTDYEPRRIANAIPNDQGRQDVLSRIRNYAQTTIERELVASVVLRVANLQKFLILSACLVLQSTGTNATDVFDVVKICIGTEASDRRCHQILKSCRYINELLENLRMRGWGLRGCELFMTWNRSPQFFYQLSCASKSSIEFLAKELGKKVRIANLPSLPTQWTSLFVPDVVCDMLGQSIHIAQISEVLGYAKDCVPQRALTDANETFQPWGTVFGGEDLMPEEMWRSFMLEGDQFMSEDIWQRFLDDSGL